ncbi:MAG: IS4 family transposase [Terracidiphilus sp.]
MHDELVKPIAVRVTRGAWYRTWRLVSLDGSTFDIADEKANEEAFSRPGASRGTSAYPQIRFVSLVENGTHVLFGSQMDSYRTGEITLAKTVLPRLAKGMLCLADRSFFGFEIWKLARGTGADLLWRMKKNMRMAHEKLLADGSYLSRVYPSERDWRHKTNGIVLRVIDYRLEGIEGSDPIYRLATTILDPGKAPAGELAALYHERWEIETAFDELKTHLRGAHIVLRSKTPDLVRQEFYGLMMAHFAIRGLMHEAALKADKRSRQALVPSRGARNSAQAQRLRCYSQLSRGEHFITRFWTRSYQERVVSSRNRRNPCGVKRKMSNFPSARATSTLAYDGHSQGH